MALSGPGNGPSEETARKAYDMRCGGASYRTIAAELAGPPHRCGGHSTARRWVRLGFLLSTRDEDGQVDPMRKRRARREMAIDELDAIRQEMAADVAAGALAHKDYYNFRIRAILAAAQLGAWAAPPPTTRVRITDSGRAVAIDPGLTAALAALPREEIDALLDGMLPDERNQS